MTPLLIENNALSKTGDFLIDELRLPRESRQALIVTDSNVGPLYKTILEGSLQKRGFGTATITIPAGEESKCFTQVERILRFAAKEQFDRQSVVCALGGGMVGDLAGFAASTYLRGVPVIQIPTTLLSQVDSCLGGKTGINLPEGKNLVGTFHQPAAIIVDPFTLNTLKQRVFNSGFAEIIKLGCIWQTDILDKIKPDTSQGYIEIIQECLRIKGDITEADPSEKGVRAILNFGHTIGHALETAAGYGTYLHGEAVGIGMLGALKISEEICGLPLEITAKVKKLMKDCQLPTTIKHPFKMAELIAAANADKKNQDGDIKFILLQQLHKPTAPTAVPINLITKTINGLTKQPTIEHAHRHEHP